MSMNIRVLNAVSIQAKCLNETQDKKLDSYQSQAERRDQMSYSLISLGFQNNYRVEPGENFEQKFVFVNDGNISWPSDTFLVFTGPDNPLELPEEIAIGEVNPGDTVTIQIQITIPGPECDHDRFQLEYELRHMLQTQSIGGPTKWTVLVNHPPSQRISGSNLISGVQGAEHEVANKMSSLKRPAQGAAVEYDFRHIYHNPDMMSHQHLNSN